MQASPIFTVRQETNYSVPVRQGVQPDAWQPCTNVDLLINHGIILPNVGVPYVAYRVIPSKVDSALTRAGHGQA